MKSLGESAGGERKTRSEQGPSNGRDRRPLTHTLGAILAGGQSRRYGSPKALASVGGVPLVVRARAALAAAFAESVVVTGDERIAREAGLPARPDVVPGRGPLAGLATALEWARERDAGGVLLVGCDMPFLSSALLRALAEEAVRGGVPALLPEGPRAHQVEPLCGWYSVRLLDPARAWLRTGRADLMGFAADSGAAAFPAADVRWFDDPEILFLNVNTREDLARAEAIASAREEARASA